MNPHAMPTSLPNAVRRLLLVNLEYAPAREVEMSADTVILGVASAEKSIIFVTTVPEGAQAISRKVWMSHPGAVIPSEAWRNGDYVGHVVIDLPQATPPAPAQPGMIQTAAQPAPQPGPSRPTLLAIFVEKQQEALVRGSARRG